jgi:CDGSH-type Zn-finger protein/uncharacterized Fe-S cluster protein YjdI
MSQSTNRFTFSGADVDATWDKRLCIHVSECTRAKGEIFASGRSPWGDPDRAEADVVVEVVARCPTGALTATRKDGGDAETAAEENTVLVSNNGPLYVRGELHIDGAPDDMAGVALRAALCRCGQSANKPFCDNAHEASGFRDHGAVGETGTGCEPGGPLEIKASRNGPLLLTGNVTVISGHGRSAWRGTKVALCRCGQSGNKPFCDGTHSKVGFRSE